MFGYKEEIREDSINLSASYFLLKNDLKNAYGVDITEKEIREILYNSGSYRVFLFGLKSFAKEKIQKGRCIM